MILSVTAVALIASAIFYNISSAKSGIEEKAKKAVAESASYQISKGTGKIISDAVSKTSDKIRQQLIQPTINALEADLTRVENMSAYNIFNKLSKLNQKCSQMLS